MYNMAVVESIRFRVTLYNFDELVLLTDQILAMI
jgi:hypothetical protein